MVVFSFFILFFVCEVITCEHWNSIARCLSIAPSGGNLCLWPPSLHICFLFVFLWPPTLEFYLLRFHHNLQGFKGQALLWSLHNLSTLQGQNKLSNVDEKWSMFFKALSFSPNIICFYVTINRCQVLVFGLLGSCQNFNPLRFFF